MGAEHQSRSYLDMFSEQRQSAALGASRELIPLSTVIPPGLTEDGTGAEPAKPKETLFGTLTRGLSLRNLTPRQMAEVSLDLYAAGILSYDDYAILAFQPELHPDYNTTIGALTGEPAGPDRARDFVNHWEDRLSFERRHNPQNTSLVRRAERIVTLLQVLDGPPDGAGRPMAA